MAITMVPLQHGYSDAGATRFHARSAPARSARVGSAHVGSAHVGSAHIGSAHVGSAHVGSAHVGTAPTRSAAGSPDARFARRRLVAGCLLAAGAVLSFVGLSARPHLATTGGRPASLDGSGQINLALPSAVAAPLVAAVADGRRYVVRSGDSLWSIASSRVRAAQLNAYLATLIALNGDGPLTTGTTLILPG
jgi:LysM repeat protein